MQHESNAMRRCQHWPHCSWNSHLNPLTFRQVTGEAQGNEASLQKFLQDINQGPKHAQVVKVEKSTISPKESESSFETG
jgi:Acylphosphatase